jgi:hypothetical protein
MKLVIAASLGVLAATVALQLVGFTEWFARVMVQSAMAQLPRPLRDRVVEECHSEIKDMRGAFPKLYVVFTCFLDAVRLERMWRTKQLRSLAKKSDMAPADKSERRMKRYLVDRDGSSDSKEGQDFPTDDVSKTSGAQPQKVSLRSFAAALRTRSSLLLRPNVYKPEYRTKQKLFVSCSGKIWRLDGGIWVNDW